MKTLWTFLRKRISLSAIAYLTLIYLIMLFNLMGVELVVRGTSVVVLRAMLALGVIVGWLLGRTSYKFWLVLLISMVSGFILTLIHIGGIDTSIWDLIKISTGYVLRLIFERSTADAAGIGLQLQVIQTRAWEILSNLGFWINDLLTGFSVYNQVSTLLSWGYLLFLFSAWFAWITRRKNQPLWGVIPAGTMLAILMTYTLEKRILLVLLLGAGLILIGLVNHEVNQREWKELKVRGASNTRERVILVVIGFSVYTMVFAGLMPSIRIKAISDPIERYLYGSEEGGEGGSGPSLEIGTFNADLYAIDRFAGLPRQKLIGSGPELAKRVVMIVQFPTTAFVQSDLPNAARYWRSYSYDRYTGVGWQASPTVEVKYRPGQEIVTIQSDKFEIITQEIRLSNSIRGILYSAGPPVTVDQDVLVSWRTAIEEDLNGDQQTLMVDDLFAATLEHIVYQVRSLVSIASDQELRLAEDDIPDWIITRYLSLPETVPDRVHLLAQDIIVNQPTRYDQAKAIEAFLRSYPYTLDLPAPPSDRDVADYFLFDLQTGYCDYYATSMVVLARSVGLPARVVVGYVGGQYEEETDRYLVTEADAHTWVEIYLGEYGWIPFEPTAARALIDDEQLILPLPPELDELPQSIEITEDSEFPWTEIELAAILILILGLWFWNRADLTRLQHMDATSLVLVIYQRLYRHSRWLELGHRKSDTLFEFNHQLQGVFKELAIASHRAMMFKDGIHEIEFLTRHAVLANYGNLPVDEKHKLKILTSWKKLRIRMRRAIWIQAWKSLGNRITKLEKETEDLNDILGDGAADGKR